MKPASLEPSASPGRTRAFTAVELSVMTTLFLIALLAFSRSVSNAVELGDTTHESAVALEAARRSLEGMGATPFEELFATYNSDPDDDPEGPGSAVGCNFEVAGLEALASDVDGMVGRIHLPDVPVAGELQLREDLQSALLGMPRDLDLDGFIDARDHSDDYLVLPVVVELEWAGSTGARVSTLRTVLTRR